ncbi:MAG: hypothetical protein IPH95_03030 [Candidatus Promineofilum sp.]|jgi:hypothetical protein|nr:hypothetical protein [Promineifilum sp.]
MLLKKGYPQIRQIGQISEEPHAKIAKGARNAKKEEHLVGVLCDLGVRLFSLLSDNLPNLPNLRMIILTA